MTDIPIPDPGWNAQLRAHGFFAIPNPDSDQPPELPPIKQWRAIWAYLLAPGAALMLVVIFATVAVTNAHPTQRPLNGMWATAIIEIVALVVVLIVFRRSTRWPDHNDPHLVLGAYKHTLQIAVTSALVSMLPTIFTATLAAVSALPLVALAAFVFGAATVDTIAPTRARVQRHSADAATLGLDLPTVIFQPTPAS